MKRVLKMSVIALLIAALFSIPTIAQYEEEGLYYSDMMIKNGTFTWYVNQSLNYYEEIPAGSNFTVKLKDSLYPGPLSEEELQKVYASIKIDGDKYTGEGFPLFWHTHFTDENGTTLTIKEDFASKPELFNTSDISADVFEVNFTLFDDPYTLYIELYIDSTTGITTRYYEHFDDGADLEAFLELIYTGYAVEASIQFLWTLVGLVGISSLVILLKKRKRVI